MNDNIFILLIILVAANIILVALAIIRSFVRRRRARPLAVAPGGYETGRERGRVVVAPRGLVSDATSLPTTPLPEMSPVSRSDPLTGLLLPAEWNHIISDEDARIHRYGHSATVVLFELDGLDRLVGVFGAAAGERVLPAVADTISRLARGADHVARLGPSRFGVLMPETNEVEAVNYVERVREACELWLESSAIALQLAIGWASPTADLALSDAVVIAQDRMFAELRRYARRSSDVEPGEPPAMHGLEGAPSPA